MPQNCDLIFSLISSPDNDTIECGCVIEARRPEDIVEKESNQAIIADIASWWDITEGMNRRVKRFMTTKGDWKTMGYQTTGCGSGSCWCIQSSKRKIGQML